MSAKASTSADAMTAWIEDRDAAERILQRYNQNLVANLPEMVMHWLAMTHTHTREATAHHTHVHAGSPHAFGLAEALQQLLAGTKDPVTREQLAAPLGIDVLVARTALHALHSMPADGLLVMGMAEEYRRVHAAVKEAMPLDVAAAPAPHMDIEVPDQLVVPLLLGSDVPLTRAHASEVVRHMLADDTATAIKLASSFAAQDAQLFAFRVGKPCQLDAHAFYVRLCDLATKAPAQLYRALTALHALGPGVFDAAAHRMPVPGLQVLAPGPSLALRYAHAVEAAFESQALADSPGS